MVGFDSGHEAERALDGHFVPQINSDLTSALDLTQAKRLPANRSITFMGDSKGGPFDIPEKLARKMLASGGNPNNRSNSDVLRPWINARDLAGVPRGMWIIDFGATMSELDAALYEAPFEFAVREIKPKREASRTTRSEWWIHERPRPDMRAALEQLSRFVATIRHSKHRLFDWLEAPTLPDSALIVFAREDDYFFGVLHSKVHELWARRQGTQVRERESGFRYTPTTCFETFPFPWPPGEEPPDDPRVQAIAAAAKNLVEKRDRWLNPEGANEVELKKRTLTNLYNQRPTWLDLAHKKLDEAVLDAYGWPHDLSDEGILERLLALNLERASEEKIK